MFDLFKGRVILSEGFRGFHAKGALEGIGHRLDQIRYDGRGLGTGKIEMKQTATQAIDLVASTGKTAGPSTAPFA
jgi:hypothetical protein